MNRNLYIHDNEFGFTPHWIAYCREKGITFQCFDLRSRAFWDAVKPGDIVMWHYRTSDLDAEKILSSLEFAGVIVFPNQSTRFGFDDKLAQAFFAKVADFPYAETNFFLKETDAYAFVDKSSLPVVAKLARGAGSQNVRLLEQPHELNRWIKKAFAGGFSSFNAWEIFRWRISQWQRGSVRLSSLVKAFVRLFIKPRYLKQLGREKEYVIFQRFIANNSFDVRIIVIGDRAFGITRQNRPNDFRASASGLIGTDPDLIDLSAVKLAFDAADRLKSDCMGFDLLKSGDGGFRIVEFCYGFMPSGYTDCQGYWDRRLRWNPCKILPYGWMVEQIIERSRELRS